MSEERRIVSGAIQRACVASKSTCVPTDGCSNPADVSCASSPTKVSGTVLRQERIRPGGTPEGALGSTDSTSHRLA